MDHPHAIINGDQQHQKKIVFKKEEVEEVSAFSLFTWKLLILVLVLFNLWAFFGSEALPPDGSYFHLWAIFIAAYCSAKAARMIGLPALLGMLIAGFIYGNLLEPQLDKTLISTLRALALMVILLRAGLRFDPRIITKFSCLFRLSLLPCTVEALILAITSTLIFDLNTIWGLLLGFTIASVSPAIIVPTMITLEEESQAGAYTDDMPGLITTAAGLDNIVALIGFSVCFSMGFTDDEGGVQESGLRSLWPLLKGPTEIVLGVATGTAFGVILWFIPEHCHAYPSSATAKYQVHRFLLLLGSSTFIIFASKHFDLPACGPIAILILATIASIRWRPYGYTNFNEDCLKKCWNILEHYLFALIAAEVRFETLEVGVLPYGVLCISLALVARILTAFLVTYGAELTLRERLFTAITWIPKASVQAAIGSAALEVVSSEADLARGRLVLTLAVLAIFTTAPLGAMALDYSRKWLLNDDDTRRRHQKKEYQILV